MKRKNRNSTPVRIATARDAFYVIIPVKFVKYVGSLKLLVNVREKMGKNKKPTAKPTIPTTTAVLANLIKASRSGTIILQAGAKYLGCSISGIKNNITIEGNGATVVGQLKFENCGKITIHNLNITDANPYGVMIVNCAGCELQSLTIIDPERSGILTANTSGVMIENCRISGAKEQHGVYCSQSGDNIEVRNNIILDCAFSGIQINAVEDKPNPNNPDPNKDSISKNVIIDGNKIDGCQRVGKAGAIQLSGVHGADVTNNDVTKHKGKFILSIWDDGSGKPALACKDITIDSNKGEFAKADKNAVSVNIGKNCSYHLGINAWQSGIKEMVQQ
jgi:hypothetical protein